MIYLTLILCFICSVLLTPLVKRLAFKIGATDKPNNRKVHEKVMPRLGGLAIYLSFMLGVLIFSPNKEVHIPIMVGAFIIVVIGMLDDKYQLPAKYKLLGQIAAALIVVFWGNVEVEFINNPFFGDNRIDFGYFAIPITILWIVGVTNAINLIDGLDGLAAGVSSIALFTIAGMAIFMGNTYVIAMASLLMVATLGFLVFNFHPAKIFMGDTGALFLGYMIAVLSLLGFKNVTVISFIIPILILGVPLSDTIFAIFRRILNKQPISAPDKSHLHHCLLNAGFTHRQTVLLIYAMAATFGMIAIIFSQAKVWGAILLIAVVLVMLELFAELIGLLGKDYQPLLKRLKGKGN
ncbi:MULTISPECIES: MraY family glycosyltransferase [Cytobacillus]|uniref:Undecaprenyl/decaprenyl-phosphate alpha-N-acetylglucosaminyl 1-phosphate transferase n=1 Tax=Cytobacillus stercorigallinarum TaxID=2762240 RepID=A0ABR8QNT8_9BACI|nr:MraY family glycosyltransferase [Cytobacillus stercorigallinarum]MBD7937186.1 undecaprenyl/decaprenyl-phosphate alpha-N-acetylglucosaminyl 1-phosphate transferase [Cytobacillus stercorigallinarum]